MLFSSEVINTKHWIPTGKFRLNKKTGKMQEVKRPVVHRRVFLTATPGASLIGLPSNIRIVRISRHGEVSYSLSGRKETQRHWWEKNADGTPLPPIVADKYTKIDKSMNRLEAINFLHVHTGNAGVIMEELDTGEPMDGDDGRNALLRYGYEEYEWVEVKAA